AKAAVGQDNNPIAGASFLANFLDYTFHSIEIPGRSAALSQICDQLREIQTLSVRNLLRPEQRGDGNAVCQAQCLGDLLLKEVPAAGSGTRFIDRPQSLGVERVAQCLKRLEHCGGVVGEI